MITIVKAARCYTIEISILNYSKHCGILGESKQFSKFEMLFYLIMFLDIVISLLCDYTACEDIGVIEFLESINSKVVKIWESKNDVAIRSRRIIHPWGFTRSQEGTSISWNVADISRHYYSFWFDVHYVPVFIYYPKPDFRDIKTYSQLCGTTIERLHWHDIAWYKTLIDQPEFLIRVVNAIHQFWCTYQPDKISEHTDEFRRIKAYLQF